MYKKIDSILRKCQKRLRLQDWNIVLHVVDAGEIEPGRVAECRYSFRNLEAVVRVLNPAHNHEEGLGFDNLEATLYHELLHIIITPIVGKDVSEDWHEQVVERIAKALANI